MEGRYMINTGTGIRPLYNLTPHPFTLYDSETGSVLMSIQSDGKIRLVRRESDETGQKISIFKLSQDLPQSVIQLEKQSFEPFSDYFAADLKVSKKELENAAFILSMPVAEYFVKKQLFPYAVLLIPDSGPEGAVRDESGRILGVKNVVIYRE